MQILPAVELFEEDFARSKLHRYQTLERLGEGTFGEVRKAVDSVSGHVVAIKFVRILSRRGGIPKAVFREVESLKQLAQCEHVVHLYDVYADEANVCLVLEYIESDLSEVISNSRFRLQRSHLKAYFLMILKSLEHCHSNNIIHRDIKPASA
jgi:serine/threonine protein kinase